MKLNLRNDRAALASTGYAKCAGLLLLGLLATGCPAGKQTSQLEPAAADKVVIKGSNTIGEELAPRLIAEFKKAHPAVAFELETKGTSYGMGALMGGFCDIAGASRLPSKEELEVADFRGVQLNDHVIGSYSVAVVVNAANPVTNLTKEQVRDIFVGAIQNWKDVGGPDAPIRLYIRDPISGTYLGFKELAMENKAYADSHHPFTNYAGIVEAVAQNPNGIGYTSFNLLKTPGVKPVSIGGEEPTAAEVNAGKYPYARTLHLYTNKDRVGQAAGEFIEFVLSEPGQTALTAAGYVPHP